MAKWTLQYRSTGNDTYVTCFASPTLSVPQTINDLCAGRAFRLAAERLNGFESGLHGQQFRVILSDLLGFGDGTTATTVDGIITLISAAAIENGATYPIKNNAYLGQDDRGTITGSPGSYTAKSGDEWVATLI